jgi:hypothetical protein
MRVDIKALKTIRAKQYSDKNITCVKCAKNETKVASGVKLTYDQYVASLREYSFDMVDPKEKYVDASTPMLVRCPQNHASEKRFSGWNQLITDAKKHPTKHRVFCENCQATNMKYNIDEVRDLFEAKGKILLDDIYVDNKTPMRYICDCGETGMTSLSNIINGHSCGKCKLSGKPKVNFEFIRKYMADNDCELITPSNIYQNQISELRFKCKCGKISKHTWKEFLARRKTCGDKECSLKKRELTNLKTYGERNVMFVPEIKQRWEEAIEKKYGSMGNFMENTWKKSMETCMEKYGEPYVYYLEKFRNSFAPKYITLPKSGRVLRCQGYEDIAIQTLVSDPDFDENDIVVGDDVPRVKYMFLGREHMYFPDIFLPSKNILIEIKSAFTLESDLSRNICKFEQADKLYDFYIWVYDKRTSQPKVCRYEDIRKMEIPDVVDYISDLKSISRPLTEYEQRLKIGFENMSFEQKFLHDLLSKGFFPAPEFAYQNAKKQCDIMCRYGHVFKRSPDMWKNDNECKTCRHIFQVKRDGVEYMRKCDTLGLLFTNIKPNEDGKQGYIITVECTYCHFTDNISSTAIDRRKTRGCEKCCKHLKTLSGLYFYQVQLSIGIE